MTATETSGAGSATVARARAVIRAGTVDDIDAIKALADREKWAMGFVHRGALGRAAARQELIVADTGTGTGTGTEIVGFCQLYRRRDRIVTIYHIAVRADVHGEGIGRALIARVVSDATARGCQAIRLKCPADLPANGFYARLGFDLVATEAGNARPLNVWELRIPEPPITALFRSVAPR